MIEFLNVSAASWVYLGLYLLTLLVHFIFVSYVVGGTFLIAFNAIRPPVANSQRELHTNCAFDWMPLMLSGAITAGVAPLLFIQLLYQRAFYTANLLLSHRWMSILPVLILVFYSLYLLKQEKFVIPRIVIFFISVVPLFGVLYTGYSFVENHLLLLQGQAAWVSFYAAERSFYFTPQVPLRFIGWLIVFGLGYGLVARVLLRQAFTLPIALGALAYLLGLSGLLLIREQFRISMIFGWEAGLTRSELSLGGLGVFVFFLLVNSGLIFIFLARVKGELSAALDNQAQS